MITKFKNTKWLTLCEIGYSFCLGQELFVADLGTPFKAGSSVVMVAMNKYTQIAVIAKESMTLFDWIKVRINILLYSKEVFVFCGRAAKIKEEFVNNIQSVQIRERRAARHY